MSNLEHSTCPLWFRVTKDYFKNPKQISLLLVHHSGLSGCHGRVQHGFQRPQTTGCRCAVWSFTLIEINTMSHESGIILTCNPGSAYCTICRRLDMCKHPGRYVSQLNVKLSIPITISRIIIVITIIINYKACSFLPEIVFPYLRERDLQGSLGVDGRTILECTLKKLVLIRGIGLIRIRIWIIEELL